MPALLTRSERPDVAREVAAGSRLPYARHVDDATIATRDGRLVQVIKLDGFPFETADTEELNYRKGVRETMLRGVANSRFALYHHVVRRETRPELSVGRPDAFSRTLAEAWRDRLSTRRLYVNDLFLTLVRRPPAGRTGLLEELLRGGRGAADPRQAQADAARDLGAINGARDSLVAALAPYGARLLTVYDTPAAAPPRSCWSSCRLLYNGEMRPVLPAASPTSAATCPTAASPSGHGGAGAGRAQVRLPATVRGHGLDQGLPRPRPRRGCSTTSCACPYEMTVSREFRLRRPPGLRWSA